MKILIDECLPDELNESVGAMGHECQTVRRAGYGSKKNGELLALAEGRWDVAAYERPQYQVPAEHDWAKSFHLDPSCEIESHEGFVTAHASLR